MARAMSPLGPRGLEATRRQPHRQSSDTGELGSASVGSVVQYQFRDSASERSTRRRKRLLGRLRNVCPHVIDMGSYWQPAFETHFGTPLYTCIRCGHRVSAYAVELIQQRLELAFERDPVGTGQRLFQDHEKASKLIEKINRRGGPP